MDKLSPHTLIAFGVLIGLLISYVANTVGPVVEGWLRRTLRGSKDRGEGR